MDAQVTTRDATSSAPTIRRGDSALVGIASLAAAGASYVVLAVAARALPSVQDNTVFVTFWSTMFACFGVLSGASIETTRTVTSALTAPPAAEGDRRPRVLTVGACLALLVAVLLGPTVPLWAPRLFPVHALTLGGLVAGAATAYALHSVVVGALAGARRWRPYSALIAADALARMGAVLLAALLGAALVGYATGAALAALTWLVLLALSPSSRAVVRRRTDAEPRTVARRLGAASVATGASALLVVGFPVLLTLTTADAEFSSAAPLLLAITLTRAPLMIPLNAYQGVAVSHFVAHRDRGLAALVPVARVVLLVGAAGTALAALLGPWLMQLLLGPDYRVAGAVLAGLTAAATVLATLTLTGALCQALTRHRAFVAGWLVAVAVAVGVLLLPLDLAPRATFALCLGPVAGVLVHLVALRDLGRPAHAAADHDEDEKDA